MKDETRLSIAANIERYGYHAVVVAGGATPRWVYTIGLCETVGVELLFAGGVYYLKDEVLELMEQVSKSSFNDAECSQAQRIASLGVEVVKVDAGWSERLLLGVQGYYGTMKPALQIVPLNYRTIDTPRADLPFSRETAGGFRWLDEPWPYDIPAKSEAMVDIGIAFGHPAIYAARWEEDYWEIFSVPQSEIDREKARLMPLGALLASDPTLEEVVTLSVEGTSARAPGHGWIAGGRESSP
jgi:hypothetical protein